jgi:hypothetical protein
VGLVKKALSETAAIAEANAILGQCRLSERLTEVILTGDPQVIAVNEHRFFRGGIKLSRLFGQLTAVIRLELQPCQAVAGLRPTPDLFGQTQLRWWAGLVDPTSTEKTGTIVQQQAFGAEGHIRWEVRWADRHRYRHIQILEPGFTPWGYATIQQQIAAAE